MTRPSHPSSSGSPASKSQPGLTAESRYFMINSLPSTYRYTVELTGSGKHKIPFSEIRGTGPPPLDLQNAYPGDLYIDTTPRDPVLWYHSSKRWKKWPGPRTQDPIAPHPDVGRERDKFLSCSQIFVGWYSESSLWQDNQRALSDGRFTDKDAAGLASASVLKAMFMFENGEVTAATLRRDADLAKKAGARYTATRLKRKSAEVDDSEGDSESGDEQPSKRKRL